jgi:cobalamin-dependent methionine synthase I
MVGNTASASRALAELCRDSEECILLAATLGVGVDRLVLRLASVSARDGFLADAMADALIEALCDLAEARVCEGLDTSGRFSPGYADLELSMGREILLLTDAERVLGIKLSEGGLMIPKKSVNAIIAIKNKKEQK